MVSAIVLRRFAGIPAAAAFLLAPSLAKADTCNDLYYARRATDNEGRALADANPGIAVVALACLATANSNYHSTHDEADATATFAVCGAIGCNFVSSGYQNCLSVGSQIILDAIRISVLQSRMRELGCNF